MNNFNIQSVNDFKSKYKNIDDNKVLRNMNINELESYLLMLYNLKYTVSQIESRYNQLVKNNNNKKNNQIDAINNAYNNIEDQLINYTPEMDKINSKYEHKKTIVWLIFSKYSKISSIIFGILVFLKLYSHFTFTIVPAILGIIGFFILYSVLNFSEGVIEGVFDLKKSKQLGVARNYDQNNFDKEIAKHNEQLRSDKQRVLSEHKKFDSKIRSDYHSIHSKFEREAQKLEVYLPSEFRSLDIIAGLYGILNAGFGDNWKEIINVYRDEKNMNDLKKHMKDIQNTLNYMNNNIMNNQKETIQAISNHSHQQQRLLKEINTGVQQSNVNIKELNDDINRGYDKLQKNQKAIKKELEDMNPKN